MSTKKTALLILAVLAAVGTASACGETAPDVTSDSTGVIPADTVSVETEENVYRRESSDLPDSYDLGGYALRVVDQTPSADALCRMVTDAENGDKINDTIYKRNHDMMDKYNFTMVGNSVDKLVDEVRKTVTADEDAYDVAIGWAYSYAYALQAENYLFNLNDVENLNLKKDYWDQNLIDSLSFDGKIYIACGDVLVQDNNENMMVVLYNRSLANDLDIENLYEVADAGKWTMDKMITLARDAAQDVNSDGQIDTNDIMGYLYASNNIVFPYLAAGNTSLCVIDDTGRPTINDDLDRAIRILDTTSVLYSEKISGNWINFSDLYNTLPNLISNKQALFQNMGLGILRRMYRECTAEFGILPMPKLDEEQDGYYTTVWRDFEAITVPTTNRNPEKTGFILEALASGSSELNENYFEVCLQSKYTRDAESYKTCMMLLDHVKYDIGFMFNFGGLYDAVNSELGAGEGSGTIMSTIESNRGKFDSAVETFMEAMKQTNQ